MHCTNIQSAHRNKVPETRNKNNIKQVLTPVITEGVLHIGNDKQQLQPRIHFLATTIY